MDAVHDEIFGSRFSQLIEPFLFSYSKELVSLLLVQCKADSKDPNLFYIAVETGMQKKGNAC